jgi:hypothetical protein
MLNMAKKFTYSNVVIHSKRGVIQKPSPPKAMLMRKVKREPTMSHLYLLSLSISPYSLSGKMFLFLSIMPAIMYPYKHTEMKKRPAIVPWIVL